MVNTLYTPAEFIAEIEEKTADGDIGHEDRKILLRDLSEIVSNINDNPDPACTPLKIRNYGSNLLMTSRNYVREYSIVGGSTTLRYETWYDQGLYHRGNDKPAKIARNENGVIIEEEYWVRGKLHRDGDKPARVEYYSSNKNVKMESWFFTGAQRRDGDKPTTVHYYEEGNIETLRWNYYRDGKKPLRLDYDMNGKIVS